MRRQLILCGTVFALALALAGCSKKTEQSATTETSTDSLLATNPVEQPQGNLTPQQQYQPPANEQTPPAPTPSSTGQAHHAAPHTTTHHTSTHTNTSTGGNASPASTAPTGITLAAGTPIDVVMKTQLSSENAQVGDAWTGEVKQNVIVGNTVVIPAGSTVSGTVNEVAPAVKGSRASLGMQVKSVTVNGTSHNVTATTEPIVAGSTRARNIGAVAGGAAAGALIGKAAGGGKGALIGGLVGAAATGLGVAKSKGYQVVIKDGTTLTFNVDQAVTMSE